MEATFLKKHFLMITILTITICLPLLTFNDAPVEANNNPQAINGILDLTNWDWAQDGLTSLDGQWEFYWQELLSPEDFKKPDKILKRELITVPMAWNKFKIDGSELSGDGYATYRVLINTSGDQILGLKIPRIFTSYNLWLDGELIASNGTVARDKKQMVSQYKPQVKYIKPETNQMEIVIQVANFRHRSGGILESIQLGSENQISELRTRNLALELFLFGSLFIIGFYHLGLFIFRTKDKSTLYFGIYALLIAIRTVLVGEIYFINLFPNFSWELAHKLQTSAYYLGVPLLFMFLKSVYPEDVSKKIYSFIKYFAFSFTCLVLFTPAKIFTQFNPIYQLFTLLLVIPYCLYLLFTICYRKREGSYLIAVGVLILILFAINDIVFLSIVLNDTANHFLRNIVTRGNLSSWGLLAFVFAQSLVLAKKLSKSFTKVELMTEELQQLNEGLEEMVKERTHALETSKEQLEKTYKDLFRSEKARQNLVQNISHDLRTPLTSIKGYVSAITDEIVQEPVQQKKYLHRVIEKVTGLEYMVQELMELSQLEARQLKLDFTAIPVELFIKVMIEKYSLDMKTEKVEFQTNFSVQQEYLINQFIMADMDRLDRVFTNILNNALKHTSENGQISLKFNITEDKQKLLIEISDTGLGIPEKDLSHIFERFYKVSKARQSSQKGSGLGLAITKEIIEYHGGEIWVESEVGVGSQFFFTLPLHFENQGDN